MGLDVRLPIGGMFLVAGLLLTVYGLLTNGNETLYARSLELNVNLWWGMIMAAFGAMMLILGRRGLTSEGVHPAEDMPEGRSTEDREHRLGLERERRH